MRSIKRLKPSSVVLTLMAGLLAAGSHWKIFENDLFWQVRAGEEVLKTRHFQHVDTWSSTALGQPWYNFQWLATVIFYWVKSLQPEYFYLPTLRAALIFLILLGCGKSIRATVKNETRRMLISLLMVPISYCVIIGRLQLRPDIFGALAFVFLLCQFFTSAQPNRRRFLSLFTLILWAQLHGGTVPIGIGVTVLSLILGPLGAGISTSKRILWSAIGILTWLITPNGFHLAEIVIQITNKYDPTWIANPDHRPLALELFNPSQGGMSFLFWGLGLAATLTTLAFLPKNSNREFLNRRFLGGVVLFLTILTCFRMRVRLYSFLFFIPIISIGIDRWLDSMAKIRPSIIAVLGGLSLLGFATAIGEVATIGRIGTGVDETQFPIDSARFLRTESLSHRFFNAYDFGGYAIDQLRDFHVAQDGREILYESLFRELFLVQSHPDRLNAVLESHGFETLLVRAPRLRWLDSGTDLHSLYYPKRLWAMVYFDRASIVYLRRVPANQGAISRYEFHSLTRSQHPLATLKELTSETSKTLYAQEVGRCLGNQPENDFCILAQATLQRLSGPSPSSPESKPSFFSR